MFKLNGDRFIEGQNAYGRGVGLRSIIEQLTAITATKHPQQIPSEEKQDEAASLALGFLDGVCASIRRIDNLLLMPKGPDG